MLVRAERRLYGARDGLHPPLDARAEFVAGERGVAF